MVKVQIAERVNAPAAEVWRLFVSDRAEELVVSLFAEKLTMENTEAGLVRTTFLPDGAVVKERLDFLDEKNFVCRYTVIERGPLPYKSYRGGIRLEKDGENACVVNLHSEFEPLGMSDDDAAGFYRKFNLDGVNKIREILCA